MMISENFSIEEMTASSTAKILKIQNKPEPQHILNLMILVGEILQPVRTKFGKPIRVTSGFRSPQLNRAVGGVANSQHLLGEAADIICDDNRALFNLFKEMIKNGEITVGQLINEHNFRWIHVSLPTAKLRNNIIGDIA